MTLREAATGARDRRLWPALVTLYLAWGSTYIAIRVMVETVPPLLGAGLRFLAAGTILVIGLVALGGRERLRVRPREVLAAGAIGTLILVGGIGLLTLAERRVPSGLAALIIASVPLCVVLLRLIAKERVGRSTLAGVIGGFVGVAILVLPGDRNGDAPLGWLAVLLAAAAFTAIGAFASDHSPLPQDTLLSTALEMVWAGGLLTILALGTGESGQLDVGELSSRSLIAFAYLVVMGSVVAYSAFVWLLANAPPSTVATYAYVNPAVALILGWALLAEEITATMLAGAFIVLASVAVAVRGRESRVQGPTPHEPRQRRRKTSTAAPERAEGGQ
jgi:drug/metabolite transporter (DMT)-like permease